MRDRLGPVLLAVLSGGLYALSFPPAALPLLGWVALVPLFLADAARLKRDLAIMRAAWGGRSNRDLAARYELRPETISRIITRRLRHRGAADS